MKIREELNETKFLLECCDDDDEVARFLFSYFALERIWSIQHEGKNMADPTDTMINKMELGKSEEKMRYRRNELNKELRKDLCFVVKRRKRYKEDVKAKLLAAKDVELNKGVHPKTM